LLRDHREEIRGPRGPIGNDGKKGATGEPGLQGAKGDKGETGNTNVERVQQIVREEIKGQPGWTFMLYSEGEKIDEMEINPHGGTLKLDSSTIQ